MAGRDLSEITRKKIPYYRRNLGVVFQDFKLLPNRTVYDNVAYALQVTGGKRREVREKVPDILRLTGLSTKLHNYPDQLSGGEQQRVSVARAFVNHPPLLLADEPTGNLDPETSVGIMQLLYRINRTGTTVVVATHDKAMVDRMRRRVIEVSQGRVVRDERTGGYSGVQSTREFGALWREGLGVRFGFFLREALRALRRNAVPSFAAVATVLVTVLVLGVFIPVVQATTGAANEIRSKVLVDVYLSNDAGAADISRVAAHHRGRDAGRRPGRVRVQAGGDPRPSARPAAASTTTCSGPTRCPTCCASRPSGPRTSSRCATRSRPMSPSGQRTVIDSSIDEVQDRKENTDKILSATRVVKLTMGLLAGLLALASLLLVANTIRLSMYARRREVEVMKLVGATDWFIRWPFVIEGVLVGALGGIAAIVLLGVVKVSLVDPLAKDFALIAAPDTMNFGLLVGVLLGAAVGVSALGSGLSLRRFLRV